MSITITESIVVSAPPNPTINVSANYEGNAGIPVSAAMSAGNAGTLSTRSTATSGVLTLSSGHGITTASVIDISWTDGELLGCSVSATTETTVTFSGGSGDDLPVVTTAIVATAPETIDFGWDGDDLVYWVIKATAKATIRFLDSSGTEIYSVTLAANGTTRWSSVMGDNPFTGEEVDRITTSNHSSTAATFYQSGVLSGTYST